MEVLPPVALLELQEHLVLLAVAVAALAEMKIYLEALVVQGRIIHLYSIIRGQLFLMAVLAVEVAQAAEIRELTQELEGRAVFMAAVELVGAAQLIQATAAMALKALSLSAISSPLVAIPATSS